MKVTITVLILLLCASGGSSQDKLKISPDNIVSSPLVFQNSKVEIIISCKTASSDPDDVYDCELAPGHTLTEAMRVMGRRLRRQQESCDQLGRDILKMMPKPMESDKKGKS